MPPLSACESHFRLAFLLLHVSEDPRRYEQWLSAAPPCDGHGQACPFVAAEGAGHERACPFVSAGEGGAGTVGLPWPLPVGGVGVIGDAPSVGLRQSF